MKRVTTLLLTKILLLAASGSAAAQSETPDCSEVPTQFVQIAELLTRLQQLGVAFGLLLGVLMYIWAGINWMRGTPDAQQRAKRVFWNTSVGIVIVLMSSGLIEFVKSVLGCGGV